MKRFNTLVNTQLLKLLEALPQDGGPVVDQDPSSPEIAKRTTPQEKSNWEMTLLDLAKTAIYNVKNNPESVSSEDEEKLTIDVTMENKDQMLDLLYKLAGKEKSATAPIIKPEPAPETSPEGEQPEPATAGASGGGTAPVPQKAGKASKASQPI